MQTAHGDVARVIAIDNQLTAEAKLDRLNTLASHSEIQQHRHQREQKNADRVDRLTRPTGRLSASLRRFPYNIACDIILE